jgi:hypothetical protein
MTMAPERTELEWPYQPEDLFEVVYDYAGAEYDLLIEKGRAVATLKVPQDPVDEQLEKRIEEHVRAIVQVRQLQTHRPYELQGLRVYQHSGGRKNIAIRVGSAVAILDVGQPDILTRDAAGNVLRDTRVGTNRRAQSDVGLYCAEARALALATRDAEQLLAFD